MALEKQRGDVVAEGPVGFRAHYEQIKTAKQMSVVLYVKVWTWWTWSAPQPVEITLT